MSENSDPISSNRTLIEELNRPSLFHSTSESEARETANQQCNIGEESVPRNNVDLELICIFKCKGRLADIFDRVALKVELITKKKNMGQMWRLEMFWN